MKPQFYRSEDSLPVATQSVPTGNATFLLLQILYLPPWHSLALSEEPGLGKKRATFIIGRITYLNSEEVTSATDWRLVDCFCS